MQYLGEILSLTVAVSWTATALFADTASHRIGALPLNFFRMALSLVLLGGFLWVVCGVPWPVYADGKTWFWLLLSGVVGYVFGDYCLFSFWMKQFYFRVLVVRGLVVLTESADNAIVDS